jgi:glutamate racemase
LFAADERFKTTGPDPACSIKPAAALTRTGTIGLLATPGTIARAYTARLIAEFASGKRVVPKGSLELVTLAEAAAQAPMFEADGGAAIDTVVLACTHFPLVRDRLERTAPSDVTYVDSGAAIARQTLRVLDGLPTPSGRSEPPLGYMTSPEAPEPGFAGILARFGFGTVEVVDVPA